MFQERKESITEREERILAAWRQQQAFEESVERRKEAPLFTFYDGPPFATGLPHYGHLLAGTIKDVIPRYKTMQGYHVPRRFGWDCHGLPIEHEIEKNFNLSGAKAIEAFGIAAFNEECRKIVLRYTEEWKKTVERSGRWVDFHNTYKTMDRSFMESVWWVLKQLYEKGLVYEGYKVMPFSAKLGTPLSNFEASENYKEVDDPAIVVSFPILDSDVHLLAWTTTPWTLVSHLALMVGPNIPYTTIIEKKSQRKFILAQARVAAHFKPEEIEVLGVTLGKELLGMRYEPPFAYFKNHPGAFRVIAEESISLDEGTGIVHSAPAFGEVDFYACRRENITPVCPVDNNGCFTEPINEYKGLFVKDADKAIIAQLKASGRLVSQGTIHHRYPFCWRSDTPLIYKAVTTWFVAVETFRDKLLKANDQIHWVPEHIKTGRFGKWLEGARDWAISRNRYWGTPIPIWRSNEGDLHVIGSIAELETLTGKKIDDLHRHHIDDLTFTLKGKEYRRISEVFDCWFESGSMPYAQNHYPFETQDFKFPADFIAEGADQTRGWFYTLTILAAALFDKPAFKNVIVNGIILAEDGAKMSKRLKNYPEPDLVISRYGADAMRLYLLASPAVYADDLRFSERGVELVLRQVLIPLWNSYSFLATYARIYHWTPADSEKPQALIDRWILSKTQSLIASVSEGLDGYELAKATAPFVAFIDQLTNWYIRRCRERFWADQDSTDRRAAFTTLYTVLKAVAQVAAPFVPFLSDAIWHELRLEAEPESVHWTDFPIVNKSLQNNILEEEMAVLQTAVSLGHSLRKDQKLKVRQPLQTLYLYGPAFLQSQKELIAEELNVKQVVFVESEEEFVTYAIKPNFKTLGKKVGALMPVVQTAILSMPQSQVKALLQGETVDLRTTQGPVPLVMGDVLIEKVVKEGLVAAHEQGITLALDTTLTPELIIEGLAREIRNKINTMRRDAGLAVVDRIDVVIAGDAAVQEAYKLHEEAIKNDILAVSVTFAPNEGTAWDLNDHSVTIHIAKH